MTLIYRLLESSDSDAAADIHRLANAVIPDYDTSLHTASEFREFYRNKVLASGPVWGAFAGSELRGFVALLPGWIDHLYVKPTFHGQGIGGALILLAQREQDRLQLYTFQSNIRARRLYERHGFEILELTDGQRNEEKMPDMTYSWKR